LIYRPEASHLGDLMRVWVRSGVVWTHDRQVFEACQSAPFGFHGSAGIPL
jgi:hypothetical protein